MKYFTIICVLNHIFYTDEVLTTKQDPFRLDAFYLVWDKHSEKLRQQKLYGNLSKVQVCNHSSMSLDLDFEN